MSAYNHTTEGLKIIRLTGAPLRSAQNFYAIVEETHAEIKKARDEFHQKAREANERAVMMMREEWKRIVEAHGYNADETWEGQFLMLDCDYIQEGAVFLRESPHDKPDERARSLLESASIPAGSKLN